MGAPSPVTSCACRPSAARVPPVRSLRSSCARASGRRHPPGGIRTRSSSSARSCRASLYGEACPVLLLDRTTTVPRRGRRRRRAGRTISRARRGSTHAAVADGRASRDRWSTPASFGPPPSGRRSPKGRPSDTGPLAHDAYGAAHGHHDPRPTDPPAHRAADVAFASARPSAGLPASSVLCRPVRARAAGRASSRWAPAQPSSSPCRSARPTMTIARGSWRSPPPRAGLGDRSSAISAWSPPAAMSPRSPSPSPTTVQHQGIGRRLIDAGIRWAQAEGFTTLTASAWIGNPRSIDSWPASAVRPTPAMPAPASRTSESTSGRHATR